jgi:hypothetical protein
MARHLFKNETKRFLLSAKVAGIKEQVLAGTD